MTKLCSSEWAAKARKRKAYRDHYRDKVFRASGVTKGADPLSFSGAPIKQRKRILKLMKITKSGGALSEEQSKMMGLLAIEMMRMGFGKGEMGNVAETAQDFNIYSYTNFKKFFY